MGGVVNVESVSVDAFEEISEVIIMSICAAVAIVVQIQAVEARRVEAVPDALRKRLKLAPFYKKHVDCDGFPILSSEKVGDEALLEAAYLIDHMLADLPKARRALIDNTVRFAVMAPTEQTTDVPEHSDLKPKEYWDRRARGVGATPQRPAVSCGAENLLNLPGDRYDAENILIHEFAHTIHEMGLNSVDATFDHRLASAFQRARERGLWENTYAATNYKEYWAEGVQSYFDTNRHDDHDHNHVDTRAELAEYDPGLFQLIDETFRKSPWRYERYEKRRAALRTSSTSTKP